MMFDIEYYLVNKMIKGSFRVYYFSTAYLLLPFLCSQFEVVLLHTLLFFLFGFDKLFPYVKAFLISGAWMPELISLFIVVSPRIDVTAWLFM